MANEKKPLTVVENYRKDWVKVGKLEFIVDYDTLSGKPTWVHIGSNDDERLTVDHLRAFLEWTNQQRPYGGKE